jgi:hypothetical protein
MTPVFTLLLLRTRGRFYAVPTQQEAGGIGIRGKRYAYKAVFAAPNRTPQTMKLPELQSHDGAYVQIKSFTRTHSYRVLVSAQPEVYASLTVLQCTSL